MTYVEAIAIAAPTERIRWLCSDDNPNAKQREKYRRLMLSLAGSPADFIPPPPLQGPCCGG
jgi:hypothetical protein